MMKDAFNFDQHVDQERINHHFNTSLPAIEVIKNIINVKLEEKRNLKNKIYFLQGRTGSGKSTYLVSELYKSFIKDENSEISVVEPRVVLTYSNAENISRNNVSLKIGEEIGYCGGNFRVNAKKKSKIIFYTSEIFNQKLILNECKSKIVIIDEVHLLDLPMISLLNTIFNSLNSDSPLFIFTSATINLNLLINYFKEKICLTSEEIYSDPLMIGYVKGKRNKDVTHYFVDVNEFLDLNKLDFTKKFSEWLVKTPLQVPIVNEECKDILIFLPLTSYFKPIGTNLERLIPNSFFLSNETNEKDLNSWRKSNKKQTLIIGYSSGYSNLSNEILKFTADSDKERRKNERKIILSTPVIETGKTIASLFIVVDLGLQFTQRVKPLNYDPNKFYGITIPISKSNVIQRLGRVGREFEGVSYSFYTKNTYDSLEQTDLPENLNSVSLAEIYLKGKNFFHLNENFSYLELQKRLDLMKENKFIIKNSVDTLIQTGLDLIKSGYLSPILTFNEVTKIEKWFEYTKIFYYLYGYKLFDSIFLARMNRKQLPFLFSPSKITLKFNLSVIDEYENLDDQTKNEVLESIIEVKKIENTIKFNYLKSPLVLK